MRAPARPRAGMAPCPCLRSMTMSRASASSPDNIETSSGKYNSLEKPAKKFIPRREICIPRRGTYISRRGMHVSRRGTDFYIDRAKLVG